MATIENVIYVLIIFYYLKGVNEHEGKTKEHLERGPNDEGIVMVYVMFSKCPHSKKK